MVMLNAAIKKMQLFVYFLIAIGFVNSICASSMGTALSDRGYFLRTHEDNVEQELRQEDEELLTEIMDVAAVLYKDLIDISALYFSGIIVDERQLWERIFMSFSKESLRVVKLLAQYGPKMLQNPKLPLREKAKKTTYIVSFVTALWIIMIYERSGQGP